MLIDDQAFQPGLAITAGQMLAPSGAAKIGTLAEQSGMDIIHLDFVIDGDRATLNDILIAAPRDHRCFVYTRCRLSQIPGTRRAVIVPTRAVRGHFRILPGEIIHMPHKPVELLGEGVTFAEQRLAQLVREGVDIRGQIEMFEVDQAS